MSTEELENLCRWGTHPPSRVDMWVGAALRIRRAPQPRVGGMVLLSEEARKRCSELVRKYYFLGASDSITVRICSELAK